MADTDDLATPPVNAFVRDVLSGLSAPQKHIPSRWLYDAHGSALFEQITELPEYYVTRTERSILEAHVDAMAAAIGAGGTLVEYGAGATVKTRLLLSALASPERYIPVDISRDFLLDAARTIAEDYPGLIVEPFVGDFLSGGPVIAPDVSGPVAGFFPGSTIGNLSDAEITRFMIAVRDHLGPRAAFIVGADLRKAADILIPAYDDASGVTAAFNLNLLTRINRELGGDFNVSAFRHEARWNDAASKIEIHIVSERDQGVTVRGKRFDFAAGETIHTEDSRKFTEAQLQALFAETGWTIAQTWTDPKDWFALILLRAA